MNPVVVIPARMGSLRLPGKPLVEIGGVPMIVQVWRRAREADIGPVLVATDDARIVRAVEAEGGRAVLTRGDHLSGTDRVHEAVEACDPRGRHDVVINLQGDQPTVSAPTLRTVLAPLDTTEVAIATLAAVITREEERHDPDIVKVVGSEIARDRLRALYFSRGSAPWGEGPFLHHVGIYAFRREALRRFVTLPPSPLERRERLEQLRALEAGLRIDVAIVDAVPLGVDNPAELERARALLRTP